MKKMLIMVALIGIANIASAWKVVTNSVTNVTTNANKEVVRSIEQTVAMESESPDLHQVTNMPDKSMAIGIGAGYMYANYFSLAHFWNSFYWFFSEQGYLYDFNIFVEKALNPYFSWQLIANINTVSENIAPSLSACFNWYVTGNAPKDGLKLGVMINALYFFIPGVSVNVGYRLGVGDFFIEADATAGYFLGNAYYGNISISTGALF